MKEDPRVEQFTTMVEADPQNELAHFGLGQALFEVDRLEESFAPLTRALELNVRLFKAYQLLGEAYDRAGQQDQAIEVVTRGAISADEHGDYALRDAMAARLTRWGATPPSFDKPSPSHTDSTAGDTAANSFQCSRCGRPAGQLEKAPLKGPLGEKLLGNVCSTCWTEWIPTGTKVINELGLDLSTPDGGRMYDQYMTEFLQLEGR